MSEERDMLEQSASKRRRLSSDEEGRNRRRYNQDEVGGHSSSSHSKRHKSRRENSYESRSPKRDGHRREKSRTSRSRSKTRKRRSKSLERRRKHRRIYSRERELAEHTRKQNGRYNSFGDNLARNNSYVGHNRRSRSPVGRNDSERRYEPYDEEGYTAPRYSRGYSDLKKEVQDLLRIEHHHVVYEGKEDSDGDIRQDVEWCYKYLDPSIRGHVTGGTAILHHRCRQCNRICLHLLGKYGTGKRMCLACASRERGWIEEEVPSWYFHKPGQCHHCRPGYF